jgi:cysteine synthase
MSRPKIRTIGNTPTIKIRCKINGIGKEVYAKCEWYNLTGSIKDRVANTILHNADWNKELTEGMKIVEATSGNMGISLTVIGKGFGYETVLFIPKTVSKERIAILKLLGAEVHLTNTLETAIKKAKRYADKNNGYYVDQFNNKNNISAHFYETGFEICDYAERFKINKFGFCAGVGSGGTLIGVAKRLKKRYENDVTITALDNESEILTKGTTGKTKVQGLNSTFKSKFIDEELIDDYIVIKDEDAIAMAQKLNKHGIPVGISGGFNFLGALLQKENRCFTVFPDDNKKYLTTELVNEIHTPLVDSIEIIE